MKEDIKEDENSEFAQRKSKDDLTDDFIEEDDSTTVLNDSKSDSSKNKNNDFELENQDQKDSPNSIQDEEIKSTNNKDFDELKDQLLREKAEFANYRRRLQAEKSEWSAQSTAKVMSFIIPALDSFDQLFSSEIEEIRSIEHPKLKGFIDGIELIRKQLLEVFTTNGVEEINPDGQDFDPALMEALSVTESNEIEKEKVTSVYQKGYKISGKIIRPARVLVTRPVEKKGE